MQSARDEARTVPTDSVLAVVAAQRNTALDELAKAQVLIDQLAAERDEARTELEKLRQSPS